MLKNVKIVVPALFLALCVWLPMQANAAGKLVELAENRMSLADAKAYCESKGAKLPRVMALDVWNPEEAKFNVLTQKGPEGLKVTIDGFGALGAPWPADLPKAVFWTSTTHGALPAEAFVLDGRGGVVFLTHNMMGTTQERVICVPK